MCVFLMEIERGGKRLEGEIDRSTLESKLDLKPKLSLQTYGRLSTPSPRLLATSLLHLLS